jgi:hypothetical protein
VWLKCHLDTFILKGGQNDILDTSVDQNKPIQNFMKIVPEYAIF